MAVCVIAPASAHEQHQAAHSSGPVTDDLTERLSQEPCRIPNTELISTDERPVRFYKDLVKDKVVAISFVYTTCTTICAPVAANVARLQDLLGDRVGREVHLVSLSIDPVTDTAPRLKAWSAHFEPRPGWTFVTGEKQGVDQILKALKVFSPRIEDHQPIIVVVNDRARACRYANGLASPEDLRQLIDQLASEPPDTTAAEP